MKNKVCNKCGRELPLRNDYFERRKDGSKDGFRGVCRECRGKRFLNSIKEDRYNEVKKWIHENSSAELIDTEFKNVDTKMSFRCECGEIFETTFYKFKNRNKRKCSKCTGQERWNEERIVKYLNKNSKCELISFKRTKNYRILLSLKCSCGDEFNVDLQYFKRKKSKTCNKCSNYKYYNIEMIKDYVENNSDCKLLDNKYINIETPMKFKCKCGEEFKTTFTNFVKQNKRHCDACGIKMSSEKKTYTYNEVKEYIESNSECILLSTDYKGCYEKLKLLCSCGEIFEVSFDKFKNQGIQNKVRCDICNNRVSIPARIINDFLENNNFVFEREYKFKDCRYKKMLPFDFYIPSLNICIEYDGEFHYKETSIGNNLKLQQIRDNVKTEYCKKNNIKLIRIPYWEKENIIEILNKELTI